MSSHTTSEAAGTRAGNRGTLSPSGPSTESRSILDTDLYKLTMLNAVLKHYPHTNVRYRFTNRSKKMRFNRAAFQHIQDAIGRLSERHLTADERDWLKSKCKYFDDDFLDHLERFRFAPKEQIELSFVNVEGEWGDLELDAHGLWSETILYEVPLMSIISEAYFLHVDTQWDYTGQIAQAKSKAKRMAEAGALVSEFGTRRRRSYRAHDLVMQGLIAGAKEAKKSGGKGALSGTSNVHFAHKYDLTPIGTIAHEWIMGTAALNGYLGSNALAMQKWEEVYPDYSLSIALTDTFSSKPFFDDFFSVPERAQKWRGLRQDSGDPKEFTRQAKKLYESLKIDPKTKVIVYSDGLSTEKVLDLKAFADSEGIGCSFGVGTSFTNDFVQTSKPDRDGDGWTGEGEPRKGESSHPLNIVIKLYEIDGRPCVKISDELTKNTGDPEAVRLVKQRCVGRFVETYARRFGLP